MNLLVCLKQIPALSAGIPDTDLGLRFPENAPQVISTLDCYALEGAALLQDQDPSCTITLLSLDASPLCGTHFLWWGRRRFWCVPPLFLSPIRWQRECFWPPLSGSWRAGRAGPLT